MMYIRAKKKSVLLPIEIRSHLVCEQSMTRSDLCSRKRFLMSSMRMNWKRAGNLMRRLLTCSGSSNSLSKEILEGIGEGRGAEVNL